LKREESRPFCRRFRTHCGSNFSTIPLYLYSLYSLDRAKNRDIVCIIRTMVIEEMLQMTLVCNVINALGDSPTIDDPAFIPTYPGPLPGGVEHQLTVHLEPFSVKQLEVFRTVEEPENPPEFPNLAAEFEEAPETIGRFYAAIKARLSKLADTDFAAPPRNQIGADFIENSIVVMDVRSAMAAIDLIVEQAEGTPQSPREIGGPDFAHFYRFTEIAKGKRLVKNLQAGPGTPPDQRYIYNGTPIIFDASGVAPAARDPRAAAFPAETDAHKSMDAFNGFYVDLSKTLQEGFNGSSDQFNSAIDDKMPALGVSARKLMSTPAPGGGSLGPSFEYFVGGRMHRIGLEGR
jgi:hypothetical protein